MHQLQRTTLALYARHTSKVLRFVYSFIQRTYVKQQLVTFNKQSATSRLVS